MYKILSEIFNNQKAFNLNFFMPEKLSDQEKQGWFTYYIMALNRELNELLDETNWKIHRKDKPMTFDRNRFKQEWVDIFKYWLCIGTLYGFTPDEFVFEYYRKSAIVRDRYEKETIASIKAADAPIVGIDIDGVLADYVKGFVAFINKTLGTDYDYTQVKEYNVPKSLGLSVNEGKLLKDLYRRSGAKRTLPTMPGAAEFTKRLKSMGVNIILLTARPEDKYSSIYYDTLHWLRENDIEFDLLLFDKSKGERLDKVLGDERKLDFFVDDVLKNLEDVSKYTNQLFLVNKPYNIGLPDLELKRINNLMEIFETYPIKPKQ